MKKTNWLIVGIVAILAALFLFGGGMMMYGSLGNRGYGVMGGYGMMSNWGYSPFGWFGMGLGMLFMWLIPTGIVALVVYGVVALTQNSGNKIPPTLQTPCPNCGKGIHADWQNCPYCSTALK